LQSDKNKSAFTRDLKIVKLSISLSSAGKSTVHSSDGLTEIFFLATLQLSCFRLLHNAQVCM